MIRIGPFVEWLILIGCPAQLEGNDADWSLCGMADYVSCLTETLILIGFSVEWLILIGCSAETMILIGAFVEWLILIGCSVETMILIGSFFEWLILIGFSVEWPILIGCSVETINLIGPCLQERAFWDLHRPPPGQLSTTEMDIKVQWYKM